MVKQKAETELSRKLKIIQIGVLREEDQKMGEEKQLQKVVF